MASEATNAEWPIVPISDVVYFQEGPGLRNWQYRDAGIPFVNIRCLKDGRLLRDEMNCLDPKEVAEKYKHFLLDAGDYVISSSGTLGRIAEVFNEDLPCMLNTSVIRFRPLDASRLDRRFLKAFLRSELFNEQILAFANGSAQLNYGPTHLKQMTMPLPSINEQRMLGEIMGALDDRTDLLRQTNTTLEAIAQALFKSWFVDFDPVRAKAEGREPEAMDTATAALFPSEFEESELGLIPKGWRVGCIGDLLTLQRGFDLPSSQRIDGEFPILAASGPSGHHQEAKATGPGVTTGRSGVLGRVFYVTEDFWPLNTSLWIKDFKIATAAYAYQFLKNVDLAHLNAGSAVPTLNRNHVHGVPCVVPDVSTVEAYTSIAAPLLKRVHFAERHALDLSELRDTLLPRLISGKLRLPDAEQFAEEVA